ncbi:S-M checkpoint control protein rad4 [Lachnellula suecica]|uniref:S-M checkpoint control protein rad4 n=1 Tax=Lachnellula suecica TaxID=602035 RepID=A0A8T9CGJ3_9HELO|nr:S-M checkpoint control protein rad4 [Lachnellula suecica]
MGDVDSAALNGLSDVSKPLADVVICCTSLPDEKRTQLVEYATQMGASHLLDLTSDVTHLIVGSHNTPKYKYVAKERPDVKPMALSWIEAVRDLWIQDKEIDVEALEKEHRLPTFASLKFSMTGCDDPVERQGYADQIEANGAVYAGDLTRHITHLVSFRTEGAKYKAAKSWKIQIVSIEWLQDSIERGMILDETLYDPTLPVGERGKGAWDRSKPTKRVSLGKRAREESKSGAEGKRKIRRTASTKLNSQHESIWGDIVGGGGSVMQVSRSGQWDSKEEEPTQQDDRITTMQQEQPVDIPAPKPPAESKPMPTRIFSGSRFYFYGFTPKKTQVLHDHLVPQGAEIAETIQELPSPRDSPSRGFMLLPHDLLLSEHPEIPASQTPIEKVTVWWVERCLHHKQFMDPSEHVIGRPFPVFPVEGFTDMTICSSAFAGIDLLHFKNAVELLGAKYSEAMTPQSSVLVTKTSVAVRKDKFEHAQQWNIPIVTAEWLWDAIEAGTRLSFKKYRCRSQKRSDSLPNTGEKSQPKDVQPADRPANVAEKRLSRAKSLPSKHPKAPTQSGLDNSAFAPDDDAAAGEIAVKQENDSYTSEPLRVASPTQEFTNKSEPLSERDPNSPTKTVSTAPARSNHPHPQPQEDISNAISDLLAKTKTAVQPPLTDATEGRKRSTHRILGRVTSNISTTSTAHSRATSVDSTATHGNAVEYPPYNNSANEQMEMLINGDKNIHKSGDSQPPATQLQYEDPEAEAVTERVMARMLGENAPPPKRSGFKEKAVTIGNFEPKARVTRQGRTGLR